MLYMKIDPDCEAIYMTGPGGRSSERHWNSPVAAEIVPKYPHRKVGGRLDKPHSTDISSEMLHISAHCSATKLSNNKTK